MNPYSTVFSDDNYYLLAYNDKYKTIMHYRVDRMDSVKMLDDDIIEQIIKDIKSYIDVQVLYDTYVTSDDI